MVKKKIKKINKVKKKKKKIKIKYSRVFLLIVIIVLIIFLVKVFLNIKITNIYVSGNDVFFKDQEVIDIAKIQNYPKTFNNPSSKIKSNLEDNVYIKSAKVKKKFLTQVFIEIEENYPLFVYKTDNKTVLLNGKKVDKIYDVPIVMNYIPDLKYQSFIEKMGLLDYDILNRISEIKYDPSDYDDERFLLYMKDGNYVYITLYKFSNLNKYIDIVKNFGNKKGIVYLDSGNYFEIKEN